MVYQTSYSQCLWLYLRRLMARMQKEATKVWRNYASGTKRKSSQQLTLSSSDGRSDAGRFWDSCSTLLRTSRYLSDTPTIILQACFTKATNTHGEYDEPLLLLLVRIFFRPLLITLMHYLIMRATLFKVNFTRVCENTSRIF